MTGTVEKVEFHTRYPAEEFFYRKISEGARNVKFWWAAGGPFSVEFEAA